MFKVPDHQVAGHMAGAGALGPLVDDSGHFYKPLQSDERGTNEVAFYTSFSTDTRVPDQIRKFFPVFHGTRDLEASDGSGMHPHLVLEDIVSSRINPSILDIKIGSSTWYPEASEAYISKCLKKDRETCSLTLGFRISGLQFYGSKETGFWKPDRKSVNSFTHDDVRSALRKFVSSNSPTNSDIEPDCSYASTIYGGPNGILAQLLELKSWFEDQTIFHFYSYARVLHGLVNRWLQDLKDDIEEPLQACFNFKHNLVGSVNQISCNLHISVNQISDGFYPCQTCRCHGISLEDAVKVKTEESCCPVTGRNIGRSDVIGNSVKVGERTILLLPSFQSPVKLKHVSSPIDFCVIERTNLGSISEGVVMGASYVVIPSTFQEIETAPDEIDQSDLNTQLFRGICSALHSMDQGLVCSSNCNIETMREATLHCYYILQPSDNGPMLLRRIAGSEVVLHIPDLNQLTVSSVRKEFEDSVKDSLSRIDVRDYNLMLHERGFHQKLNLLVKESLQFGSLSPKMGEETYEPNATQPKFSEVIGQSDSTIDIEMVRNETSKLVDLTAEEDTTSVCITEEWEQLVVNEVSEIHSPVCIFKPKLDQSVLSPPDGTRQLDAKTSRILERLEVPRQFRREPVSPNITSKGVTNSSFQIKKPLLPSQSICVPDQRAVTSSQLMKPNFQRLKRKFK